MSRKLQVSVENNFTKGLITEKHALQFPENACTDALNIFLDSKGQVVRRPGIDLEDSTQHSASALEAGEVFSEYHWTNASDVSNPSFVVQQKGNLIHFYETSASTDVSAHKKLFTLDLDAYLADGSALDPAQHLCSYAQGKASLIVVSAAIEPLRITYDTVADNIEVEVLSLKFRDFKGLDDGLETNDRPAEPTVADLVTNNPEHYYNIINQGWHAVSALSQWDTARSDMPSNADQVLLYRASETDVFDNAKVAAKAPGNSPAPKGHFILDVFNPDRTTALVNEGFSSIAASPTPLLLSQTIGVFSEKSISGSINNELLHDGVTNVAFPACTQTSGGNSFVWYARDFSGGTTKAYPCLEYRIYGTNNRGYTGVVGRSVTIRLWGSNLAIGSMDDLLGSITFNDTADESAARVITSSNTTTNYKYYLVTITPASPSLITVGEIEHYVPSDISNKTSSRPTSVAFYGTRAFYAGVESPELSNNIYFSQLIEDDRNFDKCYQQNDPTSEFYADLLPTDGGVISIPEMAKVTALYQFQSSLLVLATNGVWLIIGTSGNGFKANDFAVRKISSIGCNSPKSIVDYRGAPVWFGQDGILTVRYEANYDSYSVVSLTDESIKSFYRDIPAVCRNKAKGAYDLRDGVIYWIYSQDANNPSLYDSILTLRPAAGAFLPWEIFTYDNIARPQIEGIVYVADADSEDEPGIRFTTCFDGRLAYSKFYPSVHADWKQEYATEYKNDTSMIGYFDSYFITGHKNHSDTQRMLQPNYLYTFTKSEPNGAIGVQSIFEYTNNPNSGRWSTTQIAYTKPSNMTDVTVRRFKLRGVGRVYQLKFKSILDKPFTVLGWSTMESQNAEV